MAYATKRKQSFGTPGGKTKTTRSDSSENVELSGEEIARRAQATVDQVLLEGSRTGSPSRAMSGLAAGANPNVKTCGWTPLLYATFYGHVEVMRILIQRGANVNETNLSGVSCLSKAVERQDMGMIALLLASGAKTDVIEASTGDSLLTKAARMGSLEMVRALIQEGHASPGHKNKDGSTPLHEAAFKGHAAVVELLLENAQEGLGDVANGMGRTCLHRAAYGGHLAVARILVDYGTSLDAQDNAGYTPLHWAAFFGHEPVGKFLAQAGANLVIPDKSGKVPEQLAKFKGFVVLAQHLGAARGATPLPAPHVPESVAALSRQGPASPSSTVSTPSSLSGSSSSLSSPSFQAPATPLSAVSTPSASPSPVPSQDRNC
eukprot:TRINITY_DN1212_c0_g1_i5.p1 TRINITY_DN1212_c0_g1~~TRINITY_DN1212_c0_g1_i5.p1  ORF type:complete len:376 (+),score=97.77 TRINITY_DN1212_c0_g1_i5:172-1299(+)